MTGEREDHARSKACFGEGVAGEEALFDTLHTVQESRTQIQCSVIRGNCVALTWLRKPSRLTLLISDMDVWALPANIASVLS